MTPEFSRPLPLERIGPDEYDITVRAERGAEGDECAALATRLRLPAIESLSCRFRLRAGPGDTFDAVGDLTARLTQTCIVSLDDFDVTVTETFAVRFVPAGTEDDDPDLDSVDEIPYADAVIDLGEAAAEQLALALDPYPRKPGVTLDAGAASPAENPFARLAALRRPG